MATKPVLHENKGRMDLRARLPPKATSDPALDDITVILIRPGPVIDLAAHLRRHNAVDRAVALSLQSSGRAGEIQHQGIWYKSRMVLCPILKYIKTGVIMLQFLLIDTAWYFGQCIRGW
jgi:hypothetical protein